MLLFIAISLLFFGTFGTSKKALAANPNLINFQGKVVNADGTNVANGTYNFNFVLYDSATLGTPSDGVHDKWHELSKSVTVTDGVFQTNLGSATALPDFTTLSSLYLAIQFNSDANGYMTPRIQMTSVPYALNSDNSSALGGLAATNFVQLAQGLQTDSSTTNASIAINKTNASGTPDILLLQKSGKNALEVNNSGNTLLGQAGASGLDGTLIFNNSAGANTVTLSLQANPGSSYILKLPTTAPGLSECLQNDGSTIGQLVFAACATGGSGATSVAYSTTANANGGSISGSVLTLAKADGSNPGLLSADAQTIGGAKTFSAGTPPALDLVTITNSGQASTTTGVDGLAINFGSSNASGDALHITPSFTTNASATYNVINVDAFTATRTLGTATVNGLNLGTLTQNGSMIATAINIGNGWDSGIKIGNFDANSAGLDITPGTSGGIGIAINNGPQSGISINYSSVPTADALIITNGSQPVTNTNGNDGFALTWSASNASTDAIHITPSYAGGATDALTYNGLELDAFSPTNASGTDTVNGISIGNLTDPGATITSNAVNIGSGWDYGVKVSGNTGYGVYVNGTAQGLAVFDTTNYSLNIARSASAPTTDMVRITNSSQPSTTTGVSGIYLQFGSSNASGNAMRITPSYAGGATDALTYNGLALDAFSPTNAAGTDTVNGVSIGNLTDPGATITSSAIAIGSGWDTLISGTTAGTNIFSFTNVSLTTGGALTVASCSGCGGLSTVAFSGTSNANGGSISGSTLTLTAADATNPGLLTVSAQTISGNKTFAGGLVIQTPTSPLYQGGADSTTGAGTTNLSGTFVAGKYAYVTAGSPNGSLSGNSGTCSSSVSTGCELKIFNVSDPANPAYVGGADAGTGSSFSDFTSVYVSGKYAYVGSDDSGHGNLQVFDISNPKAPTYVGGAELSSSIVRSLYVAGRYAYLAMQGGALKIYYIGNPASPTLVSNTTGMGNAESIYVSGRYAYITTVGSASTCSSSVVTGCELAIYDIADPSTPVYKGGADGLNAGNGTDNFNSVYVTGSYAYITKAANGGTCSSATRDGCEFMVFDITDPTSPVFKGGADTLNAGTGSSDSYDNVVVAGRYAYVAKGNIGGSIGDAGTCSSTTRDGCELSVFNIYDPTSPTFLGGADSSTGSGNTQFNYVYIAGHYAYIGGSGSSGTCSNADPTGCEFRIFDISGVEATSLAAGSIDAGLLQVRNDALVYNNLNVGSSLGVGGGGIATQGGLSFAGVTLKAGSGFSYSLTFPSSLPSSGQTYCLTSSSTGTLSWSACGAGSTYTVTLTPEYPGAVMTPDSRSANTHTGTMTSDFCSGTSRLNVIPSPNPCGATDEHNYYSWTANATNDYDVFVVWQVPSDFSSFSSITLNGWTTSTSDSASLTVSKNGASCGTAGTVSTTATWGTANPGFGSCSFTSGDRIVLEVDLTVGVSGQYARAGEITIVYNRN